MLAAAAVIDSCARPLSDHETIRLALSTTAYKLSTLRRLLLTSFLSFKTFSLASFRSLYVRSIEQQMASVMNEFAYGEFNNHNNNNKYLS